MNSKVLQGGILSVLMTGRVLVFVQTLSEWDVYEVNREGSLSYCPR